MVTALIYFVSESPPYTWGTLTTVNSASVFFWSTLIRMRNTDWRTPTSPLARNHPRTHGEHYQLSLRLTRQMESPPYTRGTPGHKFYNRNDERITPVHTGNTLNKSHHTGIPIFQDHQISSTYLITQYTVSRQSPLTSPLTNLLIHPSKKCRPTAILTATERHLFSTTPDLPGAQSASTGHPTDASPHRSDLAPTRCSITASRCSRPGSGRSWSTARNSRVRSG